MFGEIGNGLGDIFSYAGNKAGACFWIFLVLILWIAIGFKSCQQIQFYRHGETVIASLSDKNQTAEESAAWYSWTDSPTNQIITRSFDIEENPAPKTIKIDYIPSTQKSRLARDSSWWPVIWFLTPVLIASVWLVRTAIKDRRRGPSPL